MRKINVLIELLKMDLPLAQYEAKTLLQLEKTKESNGFLITKINPGLIKYAYRLAYSRNLYQIIFENNISKLTNSLTNYDFSKDVKGTYKISFINISDQKIIKEVFRNTWLSIKNPKVDLDNPDSELFFIKLKNKIFYCKKLVGIYQDYKSRLPNKRDGFRPISLQPRLARAIVNLTGCLDGTFVDPFCGIGGIPLEALLMNVKTEAYDIDEVMVRISLHNFKKFGIGSSLYSASSQDFFKGRAKLHYVACDLPYGRNTRDVTKDFYLKVLKQISLRLSNKDAIAVIIFPDWVNVGKLLVSNKIKLKIEAKFSIYIHKSLSRIIHVFRLK